MKSLLSLFIICFFLSGALTAASKYDYIKIKVNDEIITNNEIESQALEVAAFNKVDLSDSLKLEQIRKRVTKQVIEEKLIDIKAGELNIGISGEQLDKEVDNFLSQRKLNKSQFEEILEKQGMSLEAFRKQYSRQLIRNKVIMLEIRSKISIDEKDLKANYEKERVPEQKARVRHILLKLDSGASEDLKTEVTNKILGLKKQIENGAAFEEIARLYSEDPSAKTNYGDLGFFEEKDIADREFAKTVFTLPTGVLSEPIRTSLGLHLVEVMEKKEIAAAPFSEVKEELYKQEFQKIFSRRYNEYIENLKKNAVIIEN